MDITYLPVPLSQVGLFTDNKYTTLITDDESILFDSTINTLIRANIYADSYYDSVEDVDQEKQLFGFNMDIRYIRETRLIDVVQGEWDMSCGAESLEDFLEQYKHTTPSSIVKVLALQPINYDLKSLRKSLRTLRNF